MTERMSYDPMTCLALNAGITDLAETIAMDHTTLSRNLVPLERGAVSPFGFGGVNAALVFGKAPA